MNFLILHGTLGKPNDNWFPWLAGELKKLGHNSLRPQLPTPDGQTPANWLKIISDNVNQLGGPSKDLVIVSHSMSPLVVCQYLQTLTTPIHSCFFVSGFAIKYPDEEPFTSLNGAFLDEYIDWPKVKQNCSKFTCFAGDNDPYVPHHVLADFASKLSTDLIIIPNGGHLNTEFGFTQFPILLQVITKNIT